MAGATMERDSSFRRGLEWERGQSVLKEILTP